MTELLTAAQMRVIEQAAIESGAVTGLELMERAGQGVVEAILDWRPELGLKPHRAVILCGPGNNGGDGFVVARLLRHLGWSVGVLLIGEPESRPEDAAEVARRWLRSGGSFLPLTTETWRKCAGWGFEIVVDAVFGAGLNRPVEGDLSELFDDLVHWPGIHEDLVAIDAPSGLCLDSGRSLGNGPPASLTVTFHRPKIGHYLERGPGRCGRIEVADIGLDHPTPQPSAICLIGSKAELTGTLKRTNLRLRGLHSRLTTSRLAKQDAGHKYTQGHALVLSGGIGRGGAARLAARGALRVGAGLVTVGCPKAAVIENAARLDAIMLRPIDDGDALREALRDKRLNALCLGPGLGTGERASGLIETALQSDRPLVLDADALTLVGSNTHALSKQYQGTPKAILLPHAGEFGRLFPDLLEKLQAPATRGPAYSKVDATREAAARSGCVVLFKGADTVIAEPSGRASVNAAVYERAAPWLATAGSGDVLAGIVTGLVARGYPLMEAAETGAWLHVEAARRFGPGLIAEDLPEQLPGVFRDLGL